jgi:hypothetical protein
MLFYLKEIYWIKRLEYENKQTNDYNKNNNNNNNNQQKPKHTFLAQLSLCVQLLPLPCLCASSALGDNVVGRAQWLLLAGRRRLLPLLDRLLNFFAELDANFALNQSEKNQSKSINHAQKNKYIYITKENAQKRFNESISSHTFKLLPSIIRSSLAARLHLFAMTRTALTSRC